MLAVAKQTGGKTLYGWYLTELMGRKKVKNQAHLAELVSEAGGTEYNITQSQVSKIMYGKSEAGAKFAGALAKALQLSEEERQEHAYLLAYGQEHDDRLSADNMERMEDYKARAQELTDEGMGADFGSENRRS